MASWTLPEDDDTFTLDAKSIVQDRSLLFKLTGVKYKKPMMIQETDFRIKVDSAIVRNQIIEYDEHLPQKCRFSDKKLSTLRTIFKADERIPKEFVPVSTSSFKDLLQLDDNSASIHLKCANWVNGCKTIAHVSLKPMDSLIYKKSTLRVIFEHYWCHKLPLGLLTNRMIPTTFSDNHNRHNTNHDDNKHNLRDEPRPYQIKQYQEAIEYNPYQHTRQVPTHSATRQRRSKWLNKESLHPEWYQSLHNYQLKEHEDPKYSHLPPCHRGSIHELSASPKASICLYNEKLAHLAIKYGKANNLSFHVDAAEGICQNDKQNNKWLSTYIIVPSPANQEPLCVFQLHTTSRHAHVFKTTFGAWYSFLTFINKGNKPRLRNFTMDCYVGYFNELCYLLNGITGDLYLKRFWLFLIKSSSLHETHQITYPRFASYFTHCSKHVMDDFMNKIQNDTKITNKKKLKSFTYGVVEMMKNSSNFNELLDAMNVYFIVIGTKCFHLKNINHLKNTVFVNNDGLLCQSKENFDLQFTHEAKHNIYSAEMILMSSKCYIYIYASVPPITGLISYKSKKWNFEFVGAIDEASYTIPNFMYSEPMFNYALNTKFPTAPLWIAKLKDLERHSNQTIEGFIRNQRHQPLTFNKKPKIDIYIFSQITYMDGCIARYLDGNKDLFTSDYRKSNTLLIDCTSKVYVGQKSIAIHQKYKNFRTYSKQIKTHQDVINDYNSFKCDDKHMKAAPDLKRSHITLLHNRRELPVKNRNSKLNDWRQYINRWLDARMSQVKKRD